MGFSLVIKQISSYLDCNVFRSRSLLLFKIFNILQRIMQRTVWFSLLLLAVSTVKLSQVHEIIVIGAGISGLQASKKLSEYGVKHLILESRNRVGGRIHAVQFEGVNVDMGAEYIHAKSNSAMHIITDDMDWEAHSTDEDEHFYYEDHGEVDSQTLDIAEQLHDKLLEKTIHTAFSSIHDMSAKEAGKQYFQAVINKKTPIVRDTVVWHSDIAANNEGADLKEMSARQFDDDHTLQYRPKGGYHSLIDAMLKQSKGKLHLGERVLKVDYSSKYIQITTDKKRSYYAKRVISSLPLGVLKAHLVKFVPPLSEKYNQLIDKIGIGNLNKLYVSFTERFWGDYGGWINFVTKEIDNNKYPNAAIVEAKDKNILCFFLAGKGSRQVQQMSQDEIKEDVTKEMKKFFHHHEIKVKNIKLSRWDSDESSLGSYSFYKVGTTKEDIIELRHPIANRIWFVGEHTHPLMSSMTQGAYQTGLWAAEEAMQSLGYDLNQLEKLKHKHPKEQESSTEDEDEDDGQ